MNVAVFFGGRSCEHNVSIVTGLQALHSFPSEHTAIPVYIDTDGVWHTGKDYLDIQYYSAPKPHSGKEVHLRPASPYLYSRNGKKLARIDCCLICNHGAGGEDGSLQGLIELAGLPYTGSGIGASAAGLDKAVMKRLFAQAELPILPWTEISAEEYISGSTAAMDRLAKLGFPVIVKPCNLGSSVGIAIAHDTAELYSAIRAALEWDGKAVVEKALVGFEEFNCAVLNGDPSEVEKPIGWKDFLTYEDKYLSKSADVRREFPADIPPELRDRIRALAVEAVRAVGADGVARVDFLRLGDELYVNEINTIPGSLSAYFYEGGTPYVIDALLRRALEVHAARSRRKFAYKPFRGESKSRNK